MYRRWGRRRAWVERDGRPVGAQDAGGEWIGADLVSSSGQSRVSKAPHAFVNGFTSTQPHPLPVHGSFHATTVGLKGKCRRDVMTHKAQHLYCIGFQRKGLPTSGTKDCLLPGNSNGQTEEDTRMFCFPAMGHRHCCALGPMDPMRRSPSPCSSRPSSPRTPPCEMLGYVGIEAVLDQLKIKAMKMGFEFNIMVVGQSGLGKSTMVNTLFKSKMWKSTVQGLGTPTPQTLKLQSVTHVIEEKGVKLKLTVTDTPGFGDQINNDKCWDPILGYISEQYERYLQEEILITRQRHIPDTRVHCCIYFVPPTGHCLRPLDIEFLQRLCRTVNVVPVIARADSLTIEERETFRRRIQHNLRTHCIEVYPQKCFDEDINDRILNSKIRVGGHDGPGRLL
ncbi:septin-12 isoform X1 [Ailuropoda melanoleuca]|uniref:septin-12 isoform X1 n=1 Tax=Ailuropoda melanoleuca TaxID=9646 RepID=UPI001493E78F|nr:septin-12 isoform X1 [Ailuropoda melanoleuca]